MDLRAAIYAHTQWSVKLTAAILGAGAGASLEQWSAPRHSGSAFRRQVRRELPAAPGGDGPSCRTAPNRSA
jgi:hypothetical protein